MDHTLFLQTERRLHTVSMSLSLFCPTGRFGTLHAASITKIMRRERRNIPLLERAVLNVFPRRLKKRVFDSSFLGPPESLGFFF